MTYKRSVETGVTSALIWLANIEREATILFTFVLTLTLYPLRKTADFPKSGNKGTLPVYNRPFESH